MYRNIFKRFLDLLFIIPVLIAISPILLIIATCLYFVNNGAGVLFLQDRPGKQGKIFKVIKFKTMNDKRDILDRLLPDSQRLTRIGRLIRSASLDELPQLFNILIGDMSLIGPRPLLISYLKYYSAEQARRHDVRPGITGWAQVNGRNTISWRQKFEYDVWYVDNISFWLDLKIFCLTIVKVFKREGINSATASTMEAFQGNEI